MAHLGRRLKGSASVTISRLLPSASPSSSYHLNHYDSTLPSGYKLMGKRFATYILGALLALALCGAGCRRDEPEAAPQRRPDIPPAEADLGRDPVPGDNPASGAPSEEEWLAMAAEARRSTSFDIYYGGYRVSACLRGRLSEAFGGREARYVAVMGFEGSEETFARRVAELDRWGVFFGAHSRGTLLAEEVARLGQTAAERPLSPLEEERLAELRAELAAEERAALSEFRLELYAEVAGRRFPMASVAPGELLSAPLPPDWFPLL